MTMASKWFRYGSSAKLGGTGKRVDADRAHPELAEQSENSNNKVVPS
jgi:hypothetical protein